MDAKWLNELFEKNPDKSKSDLARRLRLTPAGVSHILSGRRQIKAREIPKIREFFGFSPGSDTGIQASADEIVIPSADPGNSDRMVLPRSALSGRTNAPDGTLAIMTMPDDTMDPDIRTGAILIVDTTLKNVEKPGIFALETQSGTLIRRCEPVIGSSPPAIRLSPANGQYDRQTVERDKITVIGRVIGRTEFF